MHLPCILDYFHTSVNYIFAIQVPSSLSLPADYSGEPPQQTAVAMMTPTPRYERQRYYAAVCLSMTISACD